MEKEKCGNGIVSFSKMLRFKALLYWVVFAMTSCSHPFVLDNLGNDQFDTCVSACYISSSIRSDYREKTAFVKVSEAINNVFSSGDFSRNRLVLELNNSLIGLSEPVKNKVIAETLNIYDFLSKKDKIWGLQMTQEAILFNFQSQFFNKYL